MANSKSNIYPIQLQGTELCLNRYDAEIKQYRGFNKNNSPFVGGCLSNVFTREEQIEGATDDNTIIDENGDVYEVDTNGLKKNNNYVINFPDGTVFWEREKVSFPDEAMLPLCEDLYVTKGLINGVECYVVKGNVNYEYDNNQIYLVPVANADNKNFFTDQNAFNYCFFVTAGYETLVLTSKYKQRNNTYNIDHVILRKKYSEEHDKYMWHKFSFGSATNLPEGLATSTICFDETTEQIIFVIGNTVYGYKISGDSISAIGTDTTGKPPVTSPNPAGGNYQKFDNQWSVLKGNNYPSNSFVLKKVVTGYLGPGTPPGYQGFWCCMYKGLYFADGVTDQVSAREVGMLDFLDLAALYNWGNSDSADRTSNSIAEGMFTRYFSTYDWWTSVVESASDSAGGNAVIHFNCEEPGYYQGFAFEKKRPSFETSYYTWLGKYVLGDYFKFGKYYHMACNNNILSGICGKYVLLTNWNSVDCKDISLQPTADGKELLFYKEGNEWYKLYQGSPRLSKKLNQIVTNADAIKNSFDVERGISLFYAPAYNSFKAGLLTRSTVSSQVRIDAKALVVKSIDTRDYSNSLYVAGAINEYALEDNASILLNPIGFFYYNFPNAGIINNVFNFIGNLPDVKINFYTNLDEYKTQTNIIGYLYTSIHANAITDVATLIKEINYKLKGLPFPSDTNGNVTYSPDLFGKIKTYGKIAFYQEGLKGYPLIVGNNNQNIFSFYLGSEIENLEDVFIIQGQYYGIINSQIYSLQFQNGVVVDISFVVDIQGLQFVGNTPYEALFFSKTNRCLYSFIGANVLNQKQLVDKISKVRNYLYNPATQTVFLITDIGVLFVGIFGMFLLEYTDITSIFLLDNGIVLSDNSGNYRYIKYYLDEGDEGYTKENINIETSFYGMNNEMVTINDCLYFRIFSEEHEEGDLKVSATTISLSGRKTEETTFKIKASDWDKITHTIYLRYQPKTQRGLGVAFAIDSPFKIASLSVGSQPDAVLVDKVSKGAITAPSVTTNNDEW